MPVTSVAGLARQARALDRPPPCQRENPQLWFSGLPADLELARARGADTVNPERAAVLQSRHRRAARGPDPRPNPGAELRADRVAASAR